MKNVIRSVGYGLLFWAALIQTSLAAGSSASVVTLADFKTQLIAFQNELSTTVDSLQQLKAAAGGDALVKSATEYQSRLKELERQFEVIRSQGIVVKARSAEHYEAWQKELATVQNPNIREKAQRRFTESKKEFDRIVEKAGVAKDTAVPFVSELKDIGIYLQADLSPDAVKSLSNDIWKLGNKSRAVIASIGEVTEQIDRTIKSLPRS